MSLFAEHFPIHFLMQFKKMHFLKSTFLIATHSVSSISVIFDEILNSDFEIVNFEK